MPIVTTTQILNDAQKNGYAVGAFNVENAEMVQAVVEAAASLNAPVILQTTSSTLKYLPPVYFANLAKAAASKVDIPVAMHLDHGSSFELAKECIQCGYSSVMIDGSQLPFEENVAVSAKVVEYANHFGVPVEAELGTIGGKEDDTHAEGCEYTDPKQAKEFVERTGISSLAIAIGTAHGIYKVKPKLDLGRITLVKELVSIPLVMHGASGLENDVMREAAKLGMCKINFATELRIAFSDGVKAHLAEKPEEFDPKKYMAVGRTNVKELVRQKIMVCGCNDQGRYSF